MAEPKKLHPIFVAQKLTPESIAGHARFITAPMDDDDDDDDGNGNGYPTLADVESARAVVGLADGRVIAEPFYVRNDVVNAFSDEVAEQAIARERARIYKLIDDADEDDPEVGEGLKHALLLIRQNGGSDG